MSVLDLSITNPQIKQFFEGSSDEAPLDELVYLHEHPLVQPNFLSQLESIFLLGIEKVSTKYPTMESIPDRELRLAETLLFILENLSANTVALTKEEAPSIMEELRKAYQISVQLTGITIDQLK